MRRVGALHAPLRIDNGLASTLFEKIAMIARVKAWKERILAVFVKFEFGF